MQANGVYAGLIAGPEGSQHQLTVDGIFYKTKDDYGNPITVRNGDPIYGTIHVSYSDGGSSVIMQSDGSRLANHFAFQYGVLSGGNGGVDYNGYSNSYSTSYNNYNTAYATWQQNQSGNPPIFNPPFILSYVSTSLGTPRTVTCTGKLIRSNTGNTTFAVATENYPVPAPPVPPAQYYFGYWLSGSTKIFVFVSSSNES